MAKKMVLGIDPGSHHLGVAIVVKQGPTVQLVHAEALKAKRTASLYERLEELSQDLEALLGRYAIDEVAIEDVFHSKNARSAFHLGLARGVFIASCLRQKLKIFAYAPTQVKSVVTGSGRADKEQVKKMVELQFRQSLALSFDATDAIAVAVCHAFSRQIETKT